MSVVNTQGSYPQRAIGKRKRFYANSWAQSWSTFWAKFHCQQILPMLVLLLMTHSAQAVTHVQFGLNRADAAITEGYEGDLDTLAAEVNSRTVEKPSTPLLPIEERSYYPSSKPLALIVAVDTTVFDDIDRDGFYTQFGLRLDADVLDSRYWDIRVAVRILLRRPGEDYLLFHTSESFLIYGGLNSDIYNFESELLSNYPADYYDVRLELIEAYSDRVLDIVDATSTRSLSALPLESRDLVELPGPGIQSGGNGNSLSLNVPGNNPSLATSGSRDAIVREHVGSASVLIPLLALLFPMRLLAARRFRTKKA